VLIDRFRMGVRKQRTTRSSDIDPPDDIAPLAAFGPRRGTPQSKILYVVRASFADLKTARRTICISGLEGLHGRSLQLLISQRYLVGRLVQKIVANFA
jgi:hypothetical protein